MAEIQDKKKSNSFLIAVASAILGSLVTIIGQPYISNLYEETKLPIISRERSTTNISSLPDNVKDQISVITTRYALKHYSGGSGKDVSILIKGTSQLDVANLIVDPGSEPNIVTQLNKQQIKVDIKSIRPNGKIVMEITHSPDNDIVWEDLIGEGSILNISSINSDDGFDKYDFYLILFIIALLLVLIAIGIFLRKGAKDFVNIEDSGNCNGQVKTDTV